MQRGYFIQVWAKLGAVTHGDLQLPPLWDLPRVQAVEITSQNFFQAAVTQPQRVKADKNRAVCGIEIAHASDRFPLEPVEQFPDSLVSDNRNLLAEINQERSVARRLELRKVGRPCLHFVGII